MIHVDTTRLLSNACTRQLDDEIRESETASSGYYSIGVGGDNVMLVFDDEALQAAIDAALVIVDNHTPGSRRIKLYRYIDTNTHDVLRPPFDVNYSNSMSFRPHPTNSVMVDGEIRQVDHYAEATMDPYTGEVAYSDLLVREEYEYIRDALGFARHRTQTITWYREDDEPHVDTKTRIKLYEPDESIREGQKRRLNITDKVMKNISNWLYVTMTQFNDPQDRINVGRAMMQHHKIAFDMFVDASSQQILFDIRDDAVEAHEWLDEFYSTGVTVRNHILDKLNIWNIEL